MPQNKQKPFTNENETLTNELKNLKNKLVILEKLLKDKDLEISERELKIEKSVDAKVESIAQEFTTKLETMEIKLKRASQFKTNMPSRSNIFNSITCSISTVTPTWSRSSIRTSPP